MSQVPGGPHYLEPPYGTHNHCHFIYSQPTTPKLHPLYRTWHSPRREGQSHAFKGLWAAPATPPLAAPQAAFTLCFRAPGCLTQSSAIRHSLELNSE